MIAAARIAAAIGLLLGSEAAAAATIALDQICPADASGKHRFSPTGLMAASLDAAQPSRRTLDLNGDGNETEVERLDVVLLNSCSEAGSKCASDSAKIVAAQSALFATFGRKDISVTRRRGPPTAAEIAEKPWLAVKAEDGAPGSIAELLDPKERFFTVECHADSQATTATNPTTPSAKPRPKPELRVTSKLEELTRESNPDLKTIDAATLSLANDHAADKLTFAIDGILGVSLPLDSADDTLIPFVQYQRTSVRDRSASPEKTTRNPDKLGIGTVASFRVAAHDVVNLAPIYVVDYQKHSRVISIKANWIPGLLRDIRGVPIMRSNPLIPDILWWGLTPRVLVQGSHVIDAGSNADLLTSANYVRIGGDITLDLWGGGPLKNFTGSVDYKRMARVTRGPRDVDLLKTTLQYWIDGAQHVSVGYTYEHGLDEDTTSRVDDWKLSLGVRF